MERKPAVGACVRARRHIATLRKDQVAGITVFYVTVCCTIIVLGDHGGSRKARKA